MTQAIGAQNDESRSRILLVKCKPLLLNVSPRSHKQPIHTYKNYIIFGTLKLNRAFLTCI